MPRTRINWESQALKQAFERAVHQLGGLFAERTTSATVFDVMCVILSPDRAASLGLTEDKMPNKLRRERKQAREQLARARHEDLELVPPAPPAAEDEDASANDETAEELAPSGEVEADITGATVTGAAAPVATAGWRVARLVACVAWRRGRGHLPSCLFSCARCRGFQSRVPRDIGSYFSLTRYGASP